MASEIGIKMNAEATVIVLAYNEERNIARTLRSLLAATESQEYPICVYPNGCKDRTSEIALQLAGKNPRVRVRPIQEASKINAWNVSFQENTSEYLIFSDGDIEAAVDSLQNLKQEFSRSPHLIAAACRPQSSLEQWNWQRFFVGFLQRSLANRSLSAQLYMVHRSRLLARLKEKGFEKIPRGIVGDDVFIEKILQHNELCIPRVYVKYEPGEFKDYLRYLARLRWQNRQMNEYFPELPESQLNLFQKILSIEWTISSAISLFSVAFRYLVKFLFRRKIDEIYLQLGPIRRSGEEVLSSLTRAESAKEKRSE